MPAPQISPLPNPPSRSQSPDTFSTDADAFLGALPDFQEEANDQADYLDALAVDVTADAAAAEAAAAIAAGAANYQGDYNAAITYQIGESVSYTGRRYVAKTVNTGVTPADGANWFLINDGDVLGPVSATNNSLAAFDGITGKIIKEASTVSVAQGGTGAASLTANAVLVGNGTSAVSSVAPSTAGNVLISNGASWTSGTQPLIVEFARKFVTQSTSNFTIPAGVTNIRLYACGKGGDAIASGTTGGGGGGGGFGFGTLVVSVGEVINVTISGGIATVTRSGTTLITANQGSNSSGTTGGAGGTATINGVLTSGGAFTGGLGGNTCGGGGSAGSPLGDGFAGGNGVSAKGAGGGGIGGVGGNTSGSNGCGGGGGAGGAGSVARVPATGIRLAGDGGGAAGPAANNSEGAARAIPFIDPLLQPLTGYGGVGGNYDTNMNSVLLVGFNGQAGGGGGGAPDFTLNHPGNGGFGGGGGGGTNGSRCSGLGGELGGGGGGWIGASVTSSLAGGGAGGGNSVNNIGGPATVWIYY